MPLAAQIEALLRSRPNRPQSVREIAAGIPSSKRVDVEAACYHLREQQRLGRNGADTVASPYKFYLKNGI